MIKLCLIGPESSRLPAQCIAAAPDWVPLAETLHSICTNAVVRTLLVATMACMVGDFVLDSLCRLSDTVAICS